jgi:hypothetical protein
MLQFFRSRQWVVTRRLVLVGIILVLGYRTYGDAIIVRLRGPNPARDIVITRAEFRAELPGDKPVWIIGIHNYSTRYTYDQIQLQATYMDSDAKVVETDKLVVKQKLPPGDEKIIGSIDFKSRGSATRGTLAVLGAEAVK